MIADVMTFKQLLYWVMTVSLLSAVHTAIAAEVNRDGLDSVRACAGIKADTERLTCFDNAALKLTAPRFAGRLGLTTEPFEVTRPTRLRYQSDGVIFVLYLKDKDGEVLQNLHIGGGGEDSYLIEAAGTYILQINGSESWRIWLEPV